MQNPFSTANLTNGRMPFFFSTESDPTRLLERCRANQWVGQIVGPHGSGKTTLAHWLFDAQREGFSHCVRVTIRGTRPHQMKRTVSVIGSHRGSNATLNTPSNVDDERRAQPIVCGQPRTLFVIDGIERLPWWHRKLLIKGLRRSRLAPSIDQRDGLLLTTHREMIGFPVLHRTEFDLITLEKIIQHLQTESNDQTSIEIFSSDRWTQTMQTAMKRHPNDGRSVLLQLYDDYADIANKKTSTRNLSRLLSDSNHRSDD